MKASSFMPSGGFAAPAGPASYLDQIAQTATVAETAYAMEPPSFSFSEMLDGNTVAVGAGDYMNSLKVSSSMSGAGPITYLDALRIQAYQNAATNLPGYLDTL